MVKHALALSTLVLGSLTALVDARPPPPPDDYDRYPPPPPPVETVVDVDDAPSFNMFGFNMGVGAVPVDGANTLAMSLGLALEHPVFTKTRVAAEYDWLWLIRRSERDYTGDAPRPDRHATGHRAGLALRRELLAKGGRSARVFIDGELGGSIALTNDNMTGVALTPGVFTGLRLGYDIYTRRDTSPSRMFETAILVRALAVADGIGISMGIGMYWGN